MALDRTNVVSSFALIKGALIPETYEVLSKWDFALSKKQNLDRLQEENYIGAASATWLHNIAKVLRGRLDPGGRDRPLVVLAQGGFPVDEWRPLLLWHITRNEFLLRDFLQYWLFSAHQGGTFRIRSDDLHEYLASIDQRGGKTARAWTQNTISRVATGLLKIATDFGLLRGSAVREFASYHLPDRSFLYLLHALLEQEDGSPRRVIDAPDWRMFLMRPSDVENELLRLHQFRMLDFQVAGSLVQIHLRAPDALSFAQEMVA